jgi:hypothetical protein
METLDKLAFWILPHVHHADVFLSDVWGIASVVIRAMHMLDREIPFDCLAEYPNRPSSSAEQTISQLLGKGKRPCRLGFLVSLSITGELIQAVRKAIGKVGMDGVKLDEQTLYSFSNSICPVEPMCRLEEKLSFYSSVESCDLCARGSKLIPIDPRLNLLRFGKEEQVPLRPEHLRDGREFIEKHRHVDRLLRVHRDDPNDGRHHAFEIDVLTLLQEPLFIERYKQKLSTLNQKPDVVVAPDHEPGQLMAKIAAEQFGIPAIKHNDLGPTISKREVEPIRHAKHLLIVDDVLNSGSRLTGYNKSLRAGFPRLESISFLVGVARPQSSSEWVVNINSLTKHHQWSASLDCVEKIYLPRWGPDRCPWCQEYEFLSDIGGLIATPPSWLDERLRRLSERRIGIYASPLLLLSQQATDQVLPSQAVVGSAGLTQMQTLFSLVSGLQSLRNDPDEDHRLVLGFPVSNVFAIQNLQNDSDPSDSNEEQVSMPEFQSSHVFAIRNLQNYSDGLLRACLLRLVLPSEWGSVQLADLQQRLRELVVTDGEIISGEVLLAIARNSVPPFSRQAFEQLYGKWLGTQLGAFCEAVGAR